MKLHRVLALLLALAMVLPMVAGIVPVSAEEGTTEIYDLSVNNMTEPVGVEADPAFSWKMRSDVIGAAQTAYSITATSETGDVVWNTGWVESGDSTDIPYGGTALVSSTRYTVQVTVKDQAGSVLAPVSTTFETGLLEEDAFAAASFISHQTGYISETTVYTIDFDFIIDKAGQGLCFGMKDSGTFVMWQVNANNNASTDKTVILRPHFKSNGGWTAYPGGPGNLQAVDLTAAIGYNTDEILGKTVHERIEVNGTSIKTYFGKDADSLTLAYDYTHSEEIPLYNLGFRHDNSMATSIPETSYYDNIVVRDANGNVLYGNDFSKTVSLQGTDCYSLEEGKLYVYASGEIVGMLMPGEVANANSSPAFRKSIQVKSGLKSAKLYTSGLGVYENYINGQRVGTKKGDKIVYDELKPGFTDASERMSYSSYDVTWMLSEGENVLSSIVTTGWWSGGGILHQGNEMAYLAKLILTYEDGKEVIVTNTSWKTAKMSPVMSNTGIYEGEDYDATVDTSWMLPGYNDHSWNNAKINTEFQGELTAWHGPAVRVREDLELSPKTMQVYEGITGASDGYYGKINVIATYKDGQDIVLNPGQTLLVNFGQNFAGREAFTVTSEAGTTINVDHAEWLNDNNGQISRGNDGPEGSLYTANYRGARAETNYTTAGGTESWHPMFTFYGFQYLAITADKTVTIHDIRGEVLTSVQGDTGTLSTSNEDINRLISNARWGMYSNYLSIPTDCPQRDERMGWTADTQVFSQTGMFLGNNKAFLEKAAEDMRDSQYTDPSSSIYGAYPDVAPDRGWNGDGGFGWADAGIIVPYNLYMMYGDVSVIEDNWDAMCLYMDEYLANQPYGGNNTFSDHLCYETQTTTTQNMLSLSFHCWDALLMVQMANAIGNTQAAAKYQAVFEEHKQQYQDEFVNADGTLVADTQTTSLYALYVGLLPNEESVNKVADMLIANIQRSGNKLQTGFLGTAILLPTLTKIGRTDVAYSLLLQRGDPSWLYSVDQGATTFWERWNTYTVASGFGSAGMNSFNHYAYGAVIGWIYNQAAGIGYDMETPGFKHIILSPNPDPLVKTVEATYDSAYGPIVSNMRYEGDSWNYEAQIPANTTATIHVPVERIETLMVNGKAPADVTLAGDGLIYAGYSDGIATFEAVAGSFSFTTYAATRYRVTLESTTADFMMPPVEAEVTMNGQTKKVALPTTVTVTEGTEVTVKAIPMNPVDYAAAGWTDGENKLSETDTIVFTASGDLALTVGTRNIGRHSLAVGKTVIAEQVNADWAAEHLTDGQYNHLGGVNGWSSFGKGTSTTFSSEVPVVIDLGAKTEFNRIHLYPRTYPPANVNFPTAYTIYTSDDNTTWTPVYSTGDGEVTNGFAPAVIELETTANARYVKLGVTGVNKADETGGCLVQLSELGVYNVTAEEGEGSSYTVDFNEPADVELFDFYSSSNGGFAVSDGKLIPTGDGGEFKAVYKSNGQSVRSVSVELHPDGTTGKINGGLYINASDPGNDQDKINALYVGVESLCEGWDDALNRIDLVIGSFPTWEEHARVISETGNNNNLFSQGVKEPITLRVDITGNMITVTVSLVRAPSICFGTTYVADGDLSQGQVGIRSQHSTVKFDNFTVTSDVSAEVAAMVGGNYFASVTEAVEAAGNQTVYILKDTDEAIAISADVTIELAGYTLSNVTVADGATLTLIDSATDDYTGKYGSATVTGTVATFAEVDGKTYVVVSENGVYSAHCYNIAITHISLDPANDALGYKAKLYGDEVVQSHVTGIGFNLWLDGGAVKTYTTTGKQQVTLRLKNILASNGGEMNINAKAFMVFDGVTYTSTQQTTSMRQTLEIVNNSWNRYSKVQKTAVQDFVNKHLDAVAAWSVDNIISWTEEDNVLKILTIGNSFSVDSMEYFYQIAKDLGVENIKLGNLYIGGCSLATHYANIQSGKAAYTYYTNDSGVWQSHTNHSLQAAIESENWDYISFQQASPDSGKADTYDTLVDLMEEVKFLCPDAKFLWHMTWAYQSDSTHSAFPNYGSDQNTMYQAIVNAVQSKVVPNEDIVKIIPAGTAIQNARTSYLGDRLTRDGFHLTYDIGRYIAGITWVEALTGLDASKLTYRPAGVTEEAMALCIESAKNAIAAPYAVTNSQYTLEDCYLELDLNLTSGWYSSTNTSGDPYKLYASTSSLPFYATKVFSKAELPVGTIIEYTGGLNYRPEGWVNGVGTTRPDATSTKFLMITDAWWGTWTERAFNIKVASLDVTADEAASVFKIYVPLSAYEKVELSFEKAFYKADSNPATQAIASSTGLKFFTVQTFTEETLPVGSIVLNTAGRNIRLERWIDGTVKNSDGSRGPNSTAKQHVVDATWWDGFDTRAFNIPVSSLDDSQIDALMDTFVIYIPKTNAPAQKTDAISGKKIAWLGSSVTYGSASGGYSMVDVIAEERADTVCYKYAVSGTTLVNESTNSYVARLQKIDTSLELDMLVVQLSTNDATHGKSLGQISDSVDMESFDTTTVAGAIEYIIAYAKNTWDCPVVFYTGTYYESEAYAAMVELLLDIQEKWDIGVIDLWNNAEMTTLYGTAQYSQYMSDAIHPTALGYKEWWTPEFEEYMIDYWSA